jgi:hypothetical protein
MTVPKNSSLSAEHRRHDQLLVARFAVDDIDSAAQRHEAQDLVKRCSECAALAADIKTISKSVAQMPAPARRRDFRLSAQQADRLRGGRFDRFLRSLTGSSWTAVRPVAAVALSVGLVMSVVGAMPLLGAAGAAAPVPAPVDTFFAANGPTPETTVDSSTSHPIVAPGQGGVRATGGGVEGDVTSAASNGLDNAYLEGKTDDPDQQGAGQAPQATAANDGSGKELSRPLPATTSSTNNAILLAGITVSVLALVALVALYVARRRYYDPLLR